MASSVNAVEEYMARPWFSDPDNPIGAVVMIEAGIRILAVMFGTLLLVAIFNAIGLPGVTVALLTVFALLIGVGLVVVPYVRKHVSFYLD